MYSVSEVIQELKNILDFSDDMIREELEMYVSELKEEHERQITMLVD